MFSAGEKVVYSSNGVCEVKEITKLDITSADKNKLYYVLENISTNATAYIPVDSEVFLRPVMSKEDAKALIESIPYVSTEEFKAVTPKEIQKICRETISTHDTKKIIALIKFLKESERQKSLSKKKLSATEERYLSQTIMIIQSELCCSLNTSKDELTKYIKKTIGEEF